MARSSPTGSLWLRCAFAGISLAFARACTTMTQREADVSTIIMDCENSVIQITCFLNMAVPDCVNITRTKTSTASRTTSSLTTTTSVTSSRTTSSRTATTVTTSSVTDTTATLTRSTTTPSTITLTETHSSTTTNSSTETSTSQTTLTSLSTTYTSDTSTSTTRTSSTTLTTGTTVTSSSGTTMTVSTTTLTATTESATSRTTVSNTYTTATTTTVVTRTSTSLTTSSVPLAWMNGFVSFPSAGVSKEQAEAGVTKALARFLRLSVDSVREVSATAGDRRMLGEAVGSWSPFRRLHAAWNVSFELSAPAPQAPSLGAELVRMAANPGESEVREFSAFLTIVMSDLGGSPAANLLAQFSFRGITASSFDPSSTSPTSTPEISITSGSQGLAVPASNEGEMSFLYIVLITAVVTLLVACILGCAWHFVSSKYFSRDGASARTDLLAPSANVASAAGNWERRPVAGDSQLVGKSAGAGKEPAVSPEVDFPEYDPRLFGEDLADSSVLPPLDPIDQRALLPIGQEPFYTPATRPLRPSGAAASSFSPALQAPITWQTLQPGSQTTGRPAASQFVSDADAAESDVAWSSAARSVGRDEQPQLQPTALYFTIDGRTAQIFSHCLWKGTWTWTSHTAVQGALVPATLRHYRLTFLPGNRLEGQGEDATGRWNIANGTYKPGGRMRWREVSGGLLMHCDGQLHVRQPTQCQEVYEIVGAFTAFDTSLASRSLGRGKFLATAVDSEGSGRSSKSEAAESQSGLLGSGVGFYQDDRV
eukprot:TRINITY_DN59389_c0_g1_i1.p1 TRINITY_DN59389_c0_g1~~TRINITY_DN59389_c0_g1_i1.p1  ORF type:complete len:767 (+),score=88.46 TRINITY_DN59389_c0_g1_i1:139-2439(+)